MSALRFFTAIILSAAFILGSFISAAQAEGKKIYINLASRLMLFYDGDTKLAVYHLGVGKPNTPTPQGYYKILEKEINPSWIDPSDPEFEILSGPDNPLGYRWMQIYGNYGIHGTNRPDSIGHYVSNGCIRMNESDVEELYEAVEVGTPVEINYNRVVVEKSPEGDVVYYIYLASITSLRSAITTLRRKLITLTANRLTLANPTTSRLTAKSFSRPTTKAKDFSPKPSCAKG